MNKEYESKGKPNRLIKEKSPYLLQHAHDPVDWHPWSERAFDKAKMKDKPVFVSIGYSSCHWCHVMHEESFSDPEVARLLNEAFICIKVDREERPDVDRAYMAVCQAMKRSCGWPLSVILSPAKNPFFVASYIPKNSRFGMVGMVDLIPQIEEIWKTRRLELENRGRDIRRRIEALDKGPPGAGLGKEVLDDAYEKLLEDFDEKNGGFGFAPKFPTPHNLLFLLRYWNRTKKKTALEIVEKTLRAMRLGGIFDQIGFGFHRYSTDAQWLVPHFEKMLYDQALLSMAYTEAHQATGAAKFRVTSTEILDYVIRELSFPEGGFLAAEDADSNGEEGKFYLWTVDEIEKTLSSEDADLAVRAFGLKATGNYAEAVQKGSGKNILHLLKPIEQLSFEVKLTIDDLVLRLGRIQRLLFKTREKRKHPAKDDKILVDWNGLTIAALAKASTAFNEPKYLQAGKKAANFILNVLKEENGMLYHRYAKSERAIEGFLDDYSFFVWGLLEIYEACFKDKYIEAAVDVTNHMVEKFWDNDRGGFYFTAKDRNSTKLRRKEKFDGALPSGNSVALLNLVRLSLLTGTPVYEKLSSQIINAFSEDVRSYPKAHSFMLLGVDFVIGPAYRIVLVGDSQEKSINRMIAVLRESYQPNKVVLLKSPEKGGYEYEKKGGKATAYVCRNKTCMPPTNNAKKMLEYLEYSLSTERGIAKT